MRKGLMRRYSRVSRVRIRDHQAGQGKEPGKLENGIATIRKFPSWFFGGVQDEFPSNACLSGRGKHHLRPHNESINRGFQWGRDGRTVDRRRRRIFLSQPALAGRCVWRGRIDDDLPVDNAGVPVTIWSQNTRPFSTGTSHSCPLIRRPIVVIF